MSKIYTKMKDIYKAQEYHGEDNESNICGDVAYRTIILYCDDYGI